MQTPTPQYTASQTQHLINSYLTGHDILFDPDKLHLAFFPLITALLNAKISHTHRPTAYIAALKQISDEDLDHISLILNEGAIQNLAHKHHLSPNYQALLRTLIDNPHANLTHLANTLETNRGNTYKRLATLIKRDLARRHQQGHLVTYTVNPLALLTPTHTRHLETSLPTLLEFSCF